MNCNVCMDEDIETPTALISCGNVGCTFKICALCAKTYYGNPYKYTKCPQCRQTSTGDKIEELKPAKKPQPRPIFIPQSTIVRVSPLNDIMTFPLMFLYFTILLLIAWLIGTVMCLAFGIKKVLVIYKILIGFWCIASLIVIVIAIRGCYKLCK